MKKISLISFFILFLMMKANLNAQVPTQGLVGYWPFNGNANDESGSGWNGTVQGATLAADRFGNANRAYNFNGVDNQITTDCPGVLGGQPRTISAWIKTQVRADWSGVIGYGTDAFANAVHFSLGSNGVTASYGGIHIQFETDYANGGWQHFVWVVPNIPNPKIENSKVYCNGILLTNVSSSPPSGTLINTVAGFKVNIGNIHPNKSGHWFNGMIDDVRLYDRELSDAEILSLLNEPNPVRSFTINGTIKFGGNNLSGVNVILSGGKDSLATTSLDGKYSFIVKEFGDYTITPIKAGYIFAPANQVYNNLNSSQTQNFTANQTTLTTGLIGYWPFNGNANDESGSGWNGTVQGATLAADRFGNANRAYNFNGVDNQITTDCPGVLGGQPRTISAWIKTQVRADWSGVIGYGTDAFANAVHFSLGSNGVTASYGGIHIQFETDYANGGWQHFVWVVPNIPNPKIENSKVYCNGILLTNVSSSPPSGTLINTVAGFKVNIGNIHPNKSGHWFNGMIDDVRLYDRELSDGEIISLYNDLNPANIKIAGQIINKGIGLNGVTVTLSGDKDSVMTTTSDGMYGFMVVNGNYSVTPIKTGYLFTPQNKTFNNITSNQKQDFVVPPDSCSISGIITYRGDILSGVTVVLNGGMSKSIQTDANGYFSFNVKKERTYTVIPYLNGYSFIPESHTYQNISENKTGDFAAIYNATISLNKSAINYGSVKFLSGNVDSTIIITDTCSQDLIIYSFNFNSNNKFSIAESVPITVPARGSKNITVRFNPDSVGVFTDSLHLMNNSNNLSDAVIGLFGSVTSSKISANPTNINFGNVGKNSESRDTTIIIKNDGDSKLKISSIQISSQTDTSFKVLSALPSTGIILDPNTSYELKVRLNTESLGQKNCSILVNNNSQNSTNINISLSANIVPPNLEVTPSSINFRTTSNILPKDTAIVRIQAFTNITVFRAVISGDTNSFRLLKNLENVALTPGIIDTLIVEFYPRTIGTKFAMLKIQNSDPLSPIQSVNLTGIGSGSSKLFVSSANIDFGDVITGIPRDTFLIIRNDGNLALNLLSTDITGTDKNNFSIINGKAPISLDYKQVNMVKIRIIGTSLGSKSAQFQIQSDDLSTSSYKVGLSANVKSPIIIKSTSRIIFAGTNIGTYCDSVFNVKNNGNSTLHLNLLIDGPASSEFKINNYLSTINILPNQDTNITVRFTPADTGSRFARIALLSNDPSNNEISIMLVGNGKGSVTNLVKIIDPQNNSNNISINPNIIWNSSSGSISYQLQISSDPGFNNIFKEFLNLNDTSFIVNNLTYNTSYYIRVRGVSSPGVGLWSDVIKFTTIQASQNKITLISPSNNSTQLQISNDLSFEWTKSNNSVYYWLQVSTDETFQSSRSFEINEKILNNYYLLKKGSLYNNTSYYWRVKAVSDDGLNDWSDAWKFSTQQGRPNKPNIYKPGNNATQIDTSITIKWFNTGDVSSYIFEISSDKYFKTILYHLTSSENSITINSLFYAATYYCRVKGVNGSDEGDWSDVSSFTTLSNKNEMKHWSCLTDENSINTGKIYRFYLDEINNVVYALAENGLYILQTTEKGITLSKVGKNDITSVKSIIITTKKDIFVSAGSGIWKLKNNDWILVFSCSEEIILNYDKNKNEISGSYGSKITRSTDDGNTWVVENLYSFITDNCTRIDKVISLFGKTYVSTVNKSSDCTTGKVEIYLSTNNGISWQSTGFNGKDNVTFISAIIPNSSGGLLISTNYGLYVYDGANWAKLNLSGFNITSFIQSFLGDYFAALFGRGTSSLSLAKNSNDGSKFITNADSLIDGIYRSKDLGKSWECISSGLMETEITAMDFSSTGDLWVGTNSGSFYKTVIKQTNVAPSFTTAVSNINASLNQNIEIVFSAADENLDKLTFSISNNPAGSTLEKLTDNTYIFKWIPNSTGTFNNITITASDGQLSVLQSFNIIVTNNRPPVISTLNGVTEYSTIENKAISFNIMYSDPDNDLLKFIAEGTTLTSGARIDSISPNLRQFNWTPTLTGSYTLNISVSDGKSSVSIKIGITVKKTNRAPGSFTLLSPADFSTINLVYPTKTITFVWQKSVDPDIGDIVNYKFKLKGTGFSLDTIIQNQETQNISVTLDIMNKLKPSLMYQWYAIATDGMDSTFSSNPLMFSTSSSVTEVTPITTKVENFYLRQNYPNPFNPETRIQYSISEDVLVNLKIYDVYGREIETLVNKVQSAGAYSINWSPVNLPSGIYYYRIQAGKYNEIKRMTYIR